MQLTHLNSKFVPQKFPITLVCDHINNAPNVGSLFRLADAFGVDTLIFCGTKTPLGKRMAKTARETQNFVNYSLAVEALGVIKQLKQKGYHIVALEITEQSSSLHLYNNITTPLALVIGNENHGISPEVLMSCDAHIHIDMFGQNSSMNVTHATGIALFHFTNLLKT